jgi:hypothetical protein
VGWDWVHLVRRPLTGLLYQPRMIDDDDCGAIRGMRIGRGNRCTRRKPAPLPFCAPQIPPDLTPGLNLDRRGRKSATNRLSYGAAYPYESNLKVDEHCLREGDVEKPVPSFLLDARLIIFRPWRWKQYFLPKKSVHCTEQHVVISQKTAGTSQSTETFTWLWKHHSSKFM